MNKEENEIKENWNTCEHKFITVMVESRVNGMTEMKCEKCNVPATTGTRYGDTRLFILIDAKTNKIGVPDSCL